MIVVVLSFYNNMLWNGQLIGYREYVFAEERWMCVVLILHIVSAADQIKFCGFFVLPVLWNKSHKYCILFVNSFTGLVHRSETRYSWRSLIRSLRWIGFLSNTGTYRIIERRLRDFLVDGDFRFYRKRESIE